VIKFLLIASMAESLTNFRGSLIYALQMRGLEVHVAAPNLPETSSVRRKLEAAGVVVHEVDMGRTGTNPFADFRTLLSFLRLMRRVRPQYALAYTIKPVIYGSLAMWIAGVPRRFALITGLGYAFLGGAKRRGLMMLVQRLYAVALSHVHTVFFQNPDDEALFRQRNLLRLGARTCVVNGSGVDLAAFEALPLPADSTCFLLIARLLGDKGVREYAEAAGRIRKTYPEVRCLLAGWVDSNPNAIAQHELDTWVAEGALEFLGRLDDVRPAIARSSVYVLPSYREGTPRTVLEAMAMGRAIITTDAPGCRETVISGENGFLVPVKSVDELEYAMLKFIEDKSLSRRMGLRSRYIAETKYDVNKVNEKMLQEMQIL